LKISEAKFAPAREITKNDEEPFVVPGYRQRLQLKISEAK